MSAVLMSLDDITDEQLICRTIGHDWDDHPNGEVDSDLFRASSGLLMLRCSRCTTERYDYLGADMTVFQRYYRYPSSYVHVKGGTSKRSPLRAELLRRSVLIHKPPRKRKAAA